MRADRFGRRIAPWLILGMCSICLLIRSFYSFSWSDESFYLTMVHRFWLGEKMFADEWYTTQLSAPVLLPFYTFYQWFSGGNDGVYLYFRLLYWAISTAVAMFAYGTLKKYNSRIASLICSAIYLWYSRANIGGMSYYNVTLTATFVAALLFYDQLCAKKASFPALYLAGVVLAIAVVCTPFMAIPYIAVWLYCFFSKRTRTLRKELFMVTVGTLSVAALYLSYIFRQVSIKDLAENLPHILNEPELQSTNPILVIPLICGRIAWRYKWTIGPAFGLIFYVWFQSRRQGKFSAVRSGWVLMIDSVLFAVNVFLSADLLGCINIAAVIFAVPVLLLYRWKTCEDKAPLSTFGISGSGLALAFAFSSDTGLDAVAIGFVLLGIGAVLAVFQAESAFEDRRSSYLVRMVFFVVVFQTAVLRLFSVYRDAPIRELDTQITSGPAKYLYTTEAHEAQYENLQAAVRSYVRKEDRVFYSKWCFWCYLCTDNAYGVPSSWRMPLDSLRLEEYYRMYPEKIPTCVFILNPEYGDFRSSLIQNNEYADRPNENSKKGFLWEYIQENGYEEIDLECAQIYRKLSDNNGN